MLNAAPLPPIELVLTSLINELVTLSTDYILVVDDYHEITEQAIHEGLSYLLEHRPLSLQLVISSRTDPPIPLARWRALQQVVELRAADQRFTPAEIAAFLKRTVGREFTSAETTALGDRTEGWIVGLQLAVLSLHGQTDISKAVQALTGNHRYILDYLTEDALDQQSEEVRSFLLYTSILEQLSGPLCDTLLERSDSQVMLERLEQANVFINPLDSERQWYRYHSLFAETLREHLRRAEPNAIPDLHHRAAAWYEQHNLPFEAFKYSLEAGDFTHATGLLEQSAPLLLRDNHLTTLLGY